MVLIAPDKFKGTFTSAQIGEVIQDWLAVTEPSYNLRRIEMADGGEGTARILAAINGLVKETVQWKNPVGKTADCQYFISPDRSAIYIDSAAFLGKDTIADLESYSPMDATSYYLGDFVLDKYAEGVEYFVIGVGGTMTVDGGAGFLQAMGYVFLDRDCELLPSPITARDLVRIHRIIPSHEIPYCFDRMHFEQYGDEEKHIIDGLIDVDIPLLPDSQSQISSLSFARQKGVKPEELEILETGLRNYARELDDALPETGFSKRGAGGGLAMALDICNANITGGAECVFNHQYRAVLEQGYEGLFGRYHNISKVITGEGCFDLQSLHGKVTGYFIEKFAKAGTPVTIICGRNDLPSDYPLPSNVTVKILSEIMK